MVSSMTVLTSLALESRRSRALASAGQRQLLLTVGAAQRSTFAISNRSLEHMYGACWHGGTLRDVVKSARI